MQRYIITLISDTGGSRPTILVPFHPSALVSAFEDEIFKRAHRQNLPVTADTHHLTLRIHSQPGAVADPEDILSDVILESENIFAIFSRRNIDFDNGSVPPTRSVAPVNQIIEGDAIHIRAITPSTARQDRTTLTTFPISVDATIQQLHEQVACQLELPPNFEQSTLVNECNCSFARKLSEHHASPSSTFVIYDKSAVERISVTFPTKTAIDTVLQARFGMDIESQKKLHYVGGEFQANGQYKSLPIIAVCSHRRHIPAHARAPELQDEPNQTWLPVLDLHTSEMPIHSASMNKTIKESGLHSICADGVLDIFAVRRNTTSTSDQPSIGRDALFRSRAYWSPPVKQSNRGTAMLLACLRMTASLMEDMDDDEDHAALDAILHVMDLMSAFPPATRTLFLLAQGKTPNASECAALSHAVFIILERFMPVELVGNDRKRLFEGSRLLFAFILEKARSVKLHSSQLADPKTWPYLGAFQVSELRDSMTNEALWEPVQTENGVVEKNYFDAFSDGGVLYLNEMQQAMLTDEIEVTKLRVAVLNGGSQPEVTTFSCGLPTSNYTYPDCGNIAAVIDDSELNELDYLAELCGRNRLAVHKPSQLTSSISPCLTFDRNAHVAVYLGEQACGEPGRSSLVFRPLFGTEAVDTAIVEQLIAPIIKTYEAEGTGIFDASGGAAIRKLEAPDEVLIFCVDCSASMRQKTDFDEVNAEDSDGGSDDGSEEDDPILKPIESVRSTIDGDYFSRARYEDTKEQLCKHESFDDMIAMVATVANNREHLRQVAVENVFILLKSNLAIQIEQKMKELDHARQTMSGWPARNLLADLESRLQTQKTFFAGLQTHEEMLRDFLMYRARTANISTRWKWSPEDPVPATTTRPHHIPALSADLTTIPDELRCPISQDVLLDPVKAADGHTYSRHSLSQWFAIRISSPLHGTELEDSSMESQDDIAKAAQDWVDGLGFVDATQQGNGPNKEGRFIPASHTTIEFQSNFGTFKRTVSSALPINDLYKLAFRGLKARHNIFQLVLGDNRVIHPSATPLASLKLRSEATVIIRIADDMDVDRPVAADAGELALVKLYYTNQTMAVAYWVNRHTPVTVESILWKFWRSQFEQGRCQWIRSLQPWMNMKDSGDGMCTGHPCEDSTARLSSFLHRSYCYGRLGDEDVYNEAQGAPNKTLVLKVGLRTPYREAKSKAAVLSRLDVLKQMFEALINRILAYGYKTHMGLVKFSSEATVQTPISHVIENFRKATNGLSANGNTALFDALALARDQLVEYGMKYPDAKKRIICISDGADTSSKTNTAQSVAWGMLQDRISVDSICLGREDNRAMRAISHILGCYKFQPASLATALSMCELEPFLALIDRPPITAAVTPSAMMFQHQFPSRFSRALSTSPTVFNDHEFPQRKDHPSLNDSFIPLDAAARRPGGQVPVNNGGARSNLRISRLLNEMRQIVAVGPRDHYDVYVSETDMSFWKVVMQGPPETPYENGTFMLYIHAEERYPAQAPKARFVTQLRHPNVTAHGRICHSILDRDWTSDTSMMRLIDTVYGLLLQAETSDLVNTIFTLDYHHDAVEFNDEVREWVARYASKTRAEWRRALLGGEDWESS